MSEDFDIYADLEHIEREANKESQELLALKKHIAELQQQVKATEQEKTDIIRRNEILLENVSSLLLTAKAELKRKDTMISDLRRQCDNIAFGRKNHVDRNVNCANKFTQTSVAHTQNIEGAMPIECNDRLRSKSKNIDVTDPIQHRDRDRERERLCKEQVFQDREQNHRRDKSRNREIDRHRDQERNRDRYRDSDRERDRYRDSDRERDRERHSDRHRKRSQERNRPKEHKRYERISDKETYEVIRKKDLKHNDDRTRKEEMYTPAHSRANEAGEYNKNNPICSENKQKCLEIRSETSKAKNSRSQELKNNKKPAKVANTHANHMAQKSIAGQMKEFVQDTMERSATKPATSESDLAVDESFQSTELFDTNSKGQGIQVISEFRNQNVVDTSTSMTQLSSKSMDSDIQKESEAVSKSSKLSTKQQQNKDSSTAANKIIEKSKKSDRDDQKNIPKAQDNQKEVNVSNHQSQIPQSTVVTISLSTDPIVTASSTHYRPFSADERLNTNGEKVEVSESTVTDSETSNSGKVNDETNCNKEHNTVISGKETVIGLIAKAPASLIETSGTNVEFSSGDTRRFLLEVIRHEDTTESSKGHRSVVEAKNIQTNELEKKKYKSKTSSKRKSEPELEVTENPELKDLKQNELCQNTPANATQLVTISNSENEVQISNPGQLNTFHTTRSIENASHANETTNIQEFRSSEPNVDGTCNEIGSETDHHLMSGNLESNSKLTLLNDATKKLVSDESTIPKHSPATSVISEATNDKQQIHDAIPSNDTNSHCFPLRDRRSNSCYSDVLQVGKHPPQATMSIQTYFMNFNVQEVESEVISCIEQSLPTQCVEPIDESGSAVLREASDVVELEEADHINEVQKKPKTSTAEIVRERLRKKNSATLQKASHHSSEIPIPMIPLKRRLSIDSANIASKRYKLETDTPLDGNKLSVSPSGKLSSTYFSQIALPITSALDSIPRKLKSPNVKQKAHSMLMTPMVVVHSPAKPSSDTDKTVQNSYYTLDDQSSLQNIMDSLLQTPIKHESSDNVSPPCANGLDDDEDNRENIGTTNNEKLIIYSTPLSTKPLSRFSRDDDQTNALFRNATSTVEAKSTLKTFGDRKESCIPSRVDSGREGNPKKITASVQAVRDTTSKQTTHLVDKYGETSIELSVKHSKSRKRCQSPTHLLDNSSADGDSSFLNINNNCDTSSAKKKVKKMNVERDVGKSPKNDIVLKQQSCHISSTNSITTKLANLSKVFKTAVAVPKSTHLKQLTDATSANNNDTTIAKEENYNLVETLGSKTVVCQKPTVDVVNAVEKIRQRKNTPSSSKCTNEDELRFNTPLINNSSNRISSGTSVQLLANMQMPASKRSRKQKNEDENRAGLTGMQSIEKDVALVRNGTETLTKHEKKRAVRCNDTEVGKLNPQHLETQSTLPINSIDLKRLNAQTTAEPSVPVHIESSTSTRGKKIEEAERSQCVVSNVTLNLSLADNASNNHSNRKRDTPVQHVREMRIVKESPSLMRVFITRK
ncbi:protein split ends-like isoform X1 [Anopheles funestus]|uniref:protein split ends-like isoform X1 n=1 Tax=Anopheles funestus TaxID=62324 RepID=UPI0020C692D2|nr:protein split ends-like isoform X1 [Anopheles funestus]